MRNPKYWRNTLLLLGITAVMPMFSHEPAHHVTADSKYSVSPPAAGKDLVAEVVKYKR